MAEISAGIDVGGEEGEGYVPGRSYSITGKVMPIGMSLRELYYLVGLKCRVYIGSDKSIGSEESESWEHKLKLNCRILLIPCKRRF